MLNKEESNLFIFFNNKVQANFEIERQKILGQFDFIKFQAQSQSFIQTHGNEGALTQWTLFCKNLKELEAQAPEKLSLAQIAFKCLLQPVEKGALAQWISAYKHLKSIYGLRIPHLLLDADVSEEQLSLANYLGVFQLLVDLNEVPGIFKEVDSLLPNLITLNDKLVQLQAQYLSAKYPQRNIDEVIAGFSEKSELLQFPLEVQELEIIKGQYLAITKKIEALNTVSEENLRVLLKQNAMLWKSEKNEEAKLTMLAILAKTIRSTYSILPYDTQIIALLALINRPENLKGRIAQIKTGEGKSTIIAMLAAFMASQDYFVDLITSSSYLAIRDCKKYQPFFQTLGLSASHICYENPKQEHFHAQILYGTNTDFEFAMLRDGLYNMKLRYSHRDGQLIQRLFEVVIIDEVDNLFLDTALNAAQLSIRDSEDWSWIFAPILEFVKDKEEAFVDIDRLRRYLRKNIDSCHKEQLAQLSDAHLERWLKSAHTALYVKRENEDYRLKAKKGSQDLTVVPVDYENTGRSQDGTQWGYGIHQFIQLKHNIKLSPMSLIGASLSHPTYFNLYSYILGLTGTMGELIERKEIQTIYEVGSYDVPPHFKNQRQRKPDFILHKRKHKWELLLKFAKEFKQKGQPYLILFKTIDESNAFSRYLTENGVKNQLLNETQIESEDYIVAQAGEAGVITVATNTAGRGTDIILSPQSKENGGLQMTFAFYPDNLRVQDQGFGRAGRQGQFGNCWMVLEVYDEGIQSLINYPATLEFEEALCRHIFSQNQSDEPLNAEKVIQLLDKLRSNRIQQESERRASCSRQERKYFVSLQDFFSRMEKIESLAESAEFKQSIIELFSQKDLNPVSIKLQKSHQKTFGSLSQMAILMLEKAKLGIEVDWSAFASQYIRVYLEHIRLVWAIYYSKLKDPIETEESKISALEEIFAYLDNPEQMAHSLFFSTEEEDELTAYDFVSEIDVNLATNSGVTPMFIAAREGNIKVMKALIDAKADINTPNKLGATPLFIAAQDNQVAAVELLIKSGADLSQHFPSTIANLKLFASRYNEKVIGRMESFIELYQVEGAEEIKMSAYDIAWVLGHEEIKQLLSDTSKKLALESPLKANNYQPGMFADLVNLLPFLKVPKKIEETSQSLSPK